jgi:hypothetical protein
VRKVVTAIVLIAAFGAGVYLTTVDARTDDAGLIAAGVGITAAVLAAIRPRAAVIIGALVGLPVPVVNIIRFDEWASLLVLGFAMAGAFVGAYVGIVARRSMQPTV